MRSNDSFTARMRALTAAPAKPKPVVVEPTGIEVREHTSMVELSEEDQGIMMRLFERHQMTFKSPEVLLPSLETLCGKLD